jgi:ribosomal subunit interface protein
MEIHWVGFEELEEAARSGAEARLERLSSGHTDLIDVRVVGRQTRHHRHGAEEVRIVCQARGQEIVAARTRDDLALALDEALDAFEQRVRRLREKRRDRSRSEVPSPPHLGIVNRIFRDDGYGFILTDDGDEVYFHRNAVKEGLDFAQLAEGDRVGLNVEAGREGLQATTVVAPPPGEV